MYDSESNIEFFVLLRIDFHKLPWDILVYFYLRLMLSCVVAKQKRRHILDLIVFLMEIILLEAFNLLRYLGPTSHTIHKSSQ